MKDPDSGLHISMALPTAAGMLLQALYYFVGFYFIAGLGDIAVSRVTAAGNAALIIFALTHVLGIGCTTLISLAVKREDQQGVNVIQSVLADSAICGVVGLASRLHANVHIKVWSMPTMRSSGKVAIRLAVPAMRRAAGCPGLLGGRYVEWVS